MSVGGTCQTSAKAGKPTSERKLIYLFTTVLLLRILRLEFWRLESRSYDSVYQVVDLAFPGVGLCLEFYSVVLVFTQQVFNIGLMKIYM